MIDRGTGPAEGSLILGYTVKKVVPYKEINALVYELEHNDTGARHLHVATEDSENCFAVAFKTIPLDSTGVAHILEHTILCGSRKYPVRDPFFSMIKRSLSSFMNALTASDWTMYPFATPNRKDFYNLMDVYLDAVFFPTLSELSFKQEGHRIEVVPAAGDQDDEITLTFQGVVYNEMKGAMSSPDQVLSRSLMSELYPDTTYRFNSGGEPDVIPTLTHRQLLDFHQRFYHPSNAFFYTYGDIPLEEHLTFISRKVLTGVERIDPGSDVPSQPRWQTPRNASCPYAVSPEEDDIPKKHQVCVAWLTADICDSFEVMLLIILEQVLMGNPASPLYKALIDSGLGSSLCDGSGFSSDIRDTLFACGLKDVRIEDAPAIENIIMDTLADLSKNGIDKELVESAIHQIEFYRKEITNSPYPFGVKLFLTLSGSWFHGTPPEEIIEIDPYINRLNAEMEKGPVLEKAIRTWFLDNPHRVTFTLYPDVELSDKEEARTAAALDKIRQRLTSAEIEAIKDETRRLNRLQEAAEDLSVLPTLELSDIPPEIQTTPETVCSSSISCFPQPTSGIFYYTAAIGAAGIDDDLQSLVPFFCVALPRMGTKKKDYLELARLIDLHTGGMGLSAQAHTTYTEAGRCVSYASFSGKCLERKQGNMFDLVRELLCEYDFSNHDRLKQLLLEYRAGLESSVVHNGHRLAISLASRNFCPSAALSEQWYGVLQLQYIKPLTAALDEAALASIAGKLETIAATLLTRDNFKTGLTGSENMLEPAVAFAESLESTLATSERKTRFNVNDAKPIVEIPVEGWSTSTAVSFVASVFTTVRMGHPDAPVLAVISKLLRSSFLHREIREKGGAYGGFALYNSEDGHFGFASYRDPHIVNTLDVFRRAVDFIQSDNFSDADIKESILQVCSDIDRPLTPAEKGIRGFQRKLLSLSDEQRQAFKEGVLGVTKAKVIKTARDRFPEDPGQYAVAVISGKDKLEAANGELAQQLVLHKI